jgi:hypothetical protein
MSSYVLAGYFLEPETALGAVGPVTLFRARTARPTSLPAPPSRTVTAALVPLSPRLVGRAAMQAVSPSPPQLSTKVGSFARGLVPAVRAAAAAAIAPARPVTRPAFLTREPTPIIVPPILSRSAQLQQRRRAALEARAGTTMPSGASAPVPVAPIEQMALAPAAPSPNGVLPASSPFSLVDSSGGGGGAPTPDASAAEVAQLEQELAPKSATAVKQVPVVFWIGGALALLWLFGKGAGARGRRQFGGGKASWE